jgi:hypothetical protein
MGRLLCCLSYTLIVPFAVQVQVKLPKKNQLHIVTLAVVILLVFRSG